MTIPVARTRQHENYEKTMKDQSKPPPAAAHRHFRIAHCFAVFAAPLAGGAVTLILPPDALYVVLR